jgi:hypothetical protein
MIDKDLSEGQNEPHEEKICIMSEIDSYLS